MGGVAELRWGLHGRGGRVEVGVAKEGWQSWGGGCKRRVAELGLGLQRRGCRVGVGVAKTWSQGWGGGCE